jgi:hypothetical protein
VGQHRRGTRGFSDQVYDQLLWDVRGSFRLWRKRRIVAAAVLLTIALETGMNIALFGVVWSALLKPLPYANAARLFQVWRVARTAGGFTPRDRSLPDGPVAGRPAIC